MCTPSRTEETREMLASELLEDVSVLHLEQGTICHLKRIEIQDGVELLGWRGNFHRPLNLNLRDDSDRIHFSYALRGHAHFRIEGQWQGNEYEVGENQGSINFCPGLRGRFRQQGSYESVTVMVRPDVFEQWADETSPSLQRAVADGCCFMDGHRGAEMHQTARLLSQALAPAEADFGRHRLWLQAQGLGLIGLFFEEQNRQHQAASHISKEDRIRLMRARDYLLADLTQPVTLLDLAKESGLSVLKLKRGFPQLFGRSVYSLFLKHRMEMAFQMLNSEGLGVGEVAADLGYTNASHFSAAFKKQFGVNPGSLKRR